MADWFGDAVPLTPFPLSCTHRAHGQPLASSPCPRCAHSLLSLQEADARATLLCSAIY